MGTFFETQCTVRDCNSGRKCKKFKLCENITEVILVINVFLKPISEVKDCGVRPSNVVIIITIIALFAPENLYSKTRASIKHYLELGKRRRTTWR